MKKLSYLLVLGLISSSLFSCNNEEKKTNVRTINKLYEDLANSFRVSGTISEFYNDKETKSTFNTRFTTESYHYDVKTSSSEGAVNYFKSEDNYACEYIINSENKLELQKATTSDGDNMGWSFVSNPFLDEECDLSFFSKKDESTYYLDFSLDTEKNTNRNVFARNIVSKIPILNVNVFDTFELKIVDDKTSSIYIKTKEVSTTTDTIHYEVNMELNNDQTIDNYADIISPLKHESYHDTLKEAFTYMFTNGFSVIRDADVAGTKYGLINAYYGNDTVYYVDPNKPQDFSGLVLKDGKAHEIINENNKYYYEEDAYSLDGKTYDSLSSFLPKRVVPVESFIYNEENKNYVFTEIDKLSPDKFTFYFDPIMDLDEASYSIIMDTVELTLDENNHINEIKSICNESQFITYKISYNKDVLPFDITTLESYNSKTSLFGTYEGTLALKKDENTTSGIYDGKSIKITIGSQKDKYGESYTIYVVIDNPDYFGYYATDVGFYNNTFYFSIGDIDFVLTKNSDGSYKVEFTTTSNYKTYTATLTKTK